MATLDILTQLGIRHTSATTPNGSTIVVFPHVMHRDFAYGLLTNGGYTVIVSGPRGLIVQAPAKRRFRDNHPAAFRILVALGLLMILPAWYVSVPVYLILGVRWYRRSGRSLRFPFRLTVRVARTARP